MDGIGTQTIFIKHAFELNNRKLDYISKTPEPDGHTKVRWSVLKRDGLQRQSTMMNTFVRHGDVIGDIVAIY